jgi:transcriptional regulator with XRE-family HTH domain
MRLRQAREAKGYSLRDLAAAAGVSTRTVLNIEEGKGNTASCVVLASLADALGVPRGWLAFGG